eukprot:5053929-Alexandrium_andersonii.AAC.1
MVAPSPGTRAASGTPGTGSGSAAALRGALPWAASLLGPGSCPPGSPRGPRRPCGRGRRRARARS